MLIYQLVHIVEGGEAKQSSKRRGDVVFLNELVDKIGVDAARWYLVSRGHDQPIDIDVDLAARAEARRTPSTTSSTRTPGSRGSCGTPATRRLRRERRPSSAPEERDLSSGSSSSPTSCSRRPSAAAPHALPNYAIRLADDFHRFYHHHRVLESEQQAFRLGLVKATKAVLARSLDLVGVEAPDRM